MDEVVAEIVRNTQPIPVFVPSREQVERLNRRKQKVSAIERAVRKQHLDRFRLIGLILRKELSLRRVCASSRIWQPLTM